jgi:soluble lytic murein transglycosylase-like protein
MRYMGFKSREYVTLSIITVFLLASNAFAEAIEISDVDIFYSYIVKHNKKQSKQLSYALANATVNAAAQSGLPDELFVGIQKVESSFKVTAVSPKNAMGAMQVHYPTWGPSLKLSAQSRWLLFVPELNVLKGTDILKTYLEIENGSVLKALYRYLGLPDEKLNKMSPALRAQRHKERVLYAASVIRQYAAYKKYKENIKQLQYMAANAENKQQCVDCETAKTF